MQMKKYKRVLACLLAAAMLLPLGNTAVYADDDDEAAVTDTAAGEDSGEEVSGEDAETIVVEEEEEEFDSTVDEVRAYLELVGEEDGYEVYFRPEDYKDQIEAKINKEIKDGEEAKDAVKDAEKHLKHVELALVDAEKNKLVAELEEIEHTKEQSVYFSEAGRYLVFLDRNTHKVQKIRYRVSTLDSELIFLTKDKETLELYNEDYSEVRAVMHEMYHNAANTLYRNEEYDRFAILNGDRDEVWVCAKQVAENDKMTMYLDEDTAIIGLENKETGYIWWSSPMNANRDTRATKLLVAELQSSAVLTYGDSITRGVSILRSRKDAEVDYKEIDGGLTITYKYDKCGITVPVTYKLEEDYMSATVKTADIKETKTDEGMVATQLTLLGSFGAGAGDENGYFVIPDGCGSLIRFNNGKETTKSYSAKVYGRDITNVPNTKPPVTEEILMPVYGIVRKNDAMAVIVDEGDGNCSINASVSGQSLSSFNICSFNFMLRGSDTYIMSGDYGNLTVFEDGSIKVPEISVRYYPISGDGKEELSYIDVAKKYREYLLAGGDVSRKASANTAEMYLDLYGGTMKDRSILGIPVNMKTAMTSFSQAKEIVSGLYDQGVDDMVVVYNNWTNEGISGKVDNKAKPAGVLGGNSGFNQLTSYLSGKGFDFYPSVNNKVFKNGNGYYSFFDTTIRISNSYSRQMRYNLSYGVQDTSKKTQSLLSPATFTEIYGKIASGYSKKGLTGVSLGEMTSTLWGDYGKQNLGRDDVIGKLRVSYQSLNDAGLSLLADTCAAYVFPYADRISDVPLQSSGFDVFDEDVPFYQIVMHGVIPYSGTAVNAAADSDYAFLTSIATGCNPAYDMIYAEASDLKDTDLDQYYYSHYAFWSDTAASEYKLAKEILSPVSDKLIVDYEKDGDTSVTTYEDGTEIKVDYAKKTITAGGKTYSLADYEKGE